jgi:hypothetical protein
MTAVGPPDLRVIANRGGLVFVARTRDWMFRFFVNPLRSAEVSAPRPRAARSPWLMLVLGGVLGFALARFVAPDGTAPRVPERGEQRVPARSASETPQASPGEASRPAEREGVAMDAATKAIFRQEESRSRAAQKAAGTMAPRYWEEYRAVLASHGIDDPATLEQVRQRLEHLSYTKFQYAYAMADFDSKRQDLERLLKDALGDKWPAFAEREQLAKSRLQYELIEKYSQTQAHALPAALTGDIIKLIQQTEALEAGIVHGVGGPLADPGHSVSGTHLEMLPYYVARHEALREKSGRLLARLPEIGADAQTIKIIGEYYARRLTDYDALIDRSLKRVQEMEERGGYKAGSQK